MAGIPGEDELLVVPASTASDHRQPTRYSCQRCKSGVNMPEKDLVRCPGCARDVCRACRGFEPEIEAFVCLDCARVRRACRHAEGRSRLQALSLVLSMVAIAAGAIVALKIAGVWAWFAGAAITIAGIIAFAWQLGCHHTCPLCEGRAEVRRRTGQLVEYRCRQCRHVWTE